MLAFLALVLLNPFALGFFILLGLVSAAKEWDEFLVFTGLVSAGISYFLFKIDVSVILYAAFAYLVAGIVWSVWRYKRFVDTKVDGIDTTLHKANLELELRLLTPGNNKTRITSWILAWPFSMLENVTRDIINLVQSLVTNVLKSVYSYVYESSIKDIKTKQSL